MSRGLAWKLTAGAGDLYAETNWVSLVFASCSGSGTDGPSLREGLHRDKLHNARSVLADYRRHKENVWLRFSAGKKEQFWYYGELVRVFTQRRPEDPLVTEFARVIKELKNLDETG